MPVIASRTGGMPELVQDDVNGLLVPPGDIRAWRAAVDRLLDDDVSERLGRGAYATWAERFSPTEAARELEKAYADACDDRSR